jgi:3-oxoadipate enol-lactonase
VIVPAYDVAGPRDAPLLVLGSSLGTDHRMWEPQLAGLTARHRVLRYDHPGHGGSSVPPRPYSIDHLAAGVLHLLDTLGVGRFSIGGLSLGGMIAMRVAATAGDRVERLALFCTSAHLPLGWQERAARVRDGGTEAVAEAVVDRWFTPEFADRCPQVVALLRGQLLDAAPEGYAGCCEAIAAMDLRPLLPAISAPTLVVAGDRDPATPPAHAKAIADGMAGAAQARVEVVPGAHLATVESADRCTDLLLGHLNAR